MFGGNQLGDDAARPEGRGDFAANDRLRVEGMPNFVEACRKAGVKRLPHQSIGFVSASGSNAWSDEDHIHTPISDTIASRAILAARDMEKIIASSGLDWVILRGGLFYGPGTGFDDGWFGRAAAGKLRSPGDGTDYVSLVHIADMAATTVASLDRWPARQALIVCDDDPAPWREVFGYIASAVGQSMPESGGPVGFPSLRLRNIRARTALNWQPFYRSWRQGFSR